MGTTATINIKALFDASQVKSGLSEIQSSLKSLKLPDNLTANLNKGFDNANKALDDFISKTEKGVKTKADASGITKSFEAVRKELTNLDNLMLKVKGQIGDGADLSKIIKLDDKTLADIQKLENEIKNLQSDLAALGQDTNKIKALETALGNLKKGSASFKAGESILEAFKEGDFDKALNILDQITTKLEAVEKGLQAQGKSTAGVEATVKAFDSMRTVIVNTQKEASTIYDQIGEKSAEAAQKTSDAYSQVTGEINNSATALNNYRNSAVNAEKAVVDLTTRQAQFVREVDQVKSRIQYFFGLSNAINLVKRAVRGAVDTIKDLDKAMTETAVVTDFTVSDMWKQLPEYTKRANELGVTTQQAYESATLFYQQGLNTQQAAALSTETLKMARIAGLDAAEATDRMTNALRGFNMELDAQSAQRVDDVYSQLAAHTASNVDEISTAMTKVASLAHSANMEFETTAAFLAQIIETTRESAETAGTALKTVVARFSEVKKLYGEDQLKGTDEEGQAIDVNKIGTALRTAGIDLNKYFLGEVGLDDIFMELASKWDTLSSVQQRYIATQAAGSRQQSRFIALMQDYARTQELVGLAYDADGASAKQFEKTQESLQSKLARLKNAWNEFLMGLANSGIVKGAVDALTGILNIINKITGALGSGAGGVLKWVTALGALGGARQLFSDGGLGTRIVGSLISNNPIGNQVRARLGLGTIDAETGAYTPRLNAKGQQVGLFGGGLFSGLHDKLQNKLVAAQQAKKGFLTYKNMASEAMGMGETNPYAEEMALYRSQMLFGKFRKSKVGNIAAKGLAKLGFGGATGAAGISGAAALAATIGTVTVAATAAAAAIKLLYDFSPKGQLKNAQKLADSMSDVATKARQSADSVKKAKLQNEEYTQAIKDAATTEDRTKAIQNRNEYIQSLLEQDATYAKYLTTTFENGQIVLTFDEDALANAANKAAEAAVKASVGATFAQATVSGRQANLYNAQIQNAGVDLLAKTIRDWDSEGNEIIRQMTESEYAKYTKLAIDAEAANAQMRQQAKNAYAQLIDADKLGDELADELASAMATSFNPSDLDTANWSFLRSRGHWENEYLKVYGTEADTSLKTTDIARAVKQGQQTTEKTEAVSQITDLLTGPQSDLYRLALDAFQGVGQAAELSFSELGENFTAEDVLKAVGIDVSSEADTLNKLAPLAVALGTDITTLRNTIVNQAKQNKEIIKQNKANLFQQSLESGLTVDLDLFKQIQGLSPKLASIISDISSQAIDLLSQEDMQQLLPNLLEMDETSLTQFTDFFSNFNLDNPIQAFAKLKAAQKDALTLPNDDPFRVMLDNIEEANKAIFDTGNLVQTFVTSEGYDSLADSIDDFIKKNGKITAANIEELADSCSDLQSILDNTTISAQGLAEAFTLLEQGNIPIDNITSSLLAALGAGESFETLMGKVQEWIEGFDEGPDMTQGTEHIIDVLDKAGDYVSKWQFGNKPLANIYDHIFGEGAYDAYMDSNWGTKGFDELEKDLTKKINRVKGYAKNDGEGALKKLAKDKKAGITANGDGTYNWNLDKYKNEEDPVAAAIKDVADGLKVGEDAARAFIEAWGSHMWDLGQEWDNLNFDQKMKAYAQDLGNNTIITQQELDALKKATGKTSEEIIQAINDARNAADKPIVVKVNWKNDDGSNKTGPELVNDVKSTLSELGSSYDQLTNKFSKELPDKIGRAIPLDKTIDFSRLSQYLTESLKLTPAQANEVANSISQETGKKLSKDIEIPIRADDGSIKTETRTITATTAEALEAGVNAAMEAANYALVAEELANATDFSTVGSKLEASLREGANKLPGIVSAAAQDVSVTIPIHWDPDPIPEGATGGITRSSGGGRASGGVIKSYAKGSENFHVSPGTALTGEEGPELVWNKNGGYAYLTGEKGPEFQDLQPGDRIFNAEETKKIMHNSAATGGIIDAYASGGWKPITDNKKKGGSGSGSGGGSSSSTDDKDDEWKNEIDWLYNLVENIEELERQQTQLQEEYNDLLKDDTKTGQDLYNMLIKQLGNLYTQLDHQTFALEKREQEMREFMDQTNDMDEYLWYNWNDRTIEIDWDKIDKIADQEKYDHISDLIDQAEEIQDKMDDAEDGIIDVKNAIEDLENIWRDTYVDFEERILKAIVKSYQIVIDNYSELNDTLNDTNQSILEAINKEISLQRQIRDNTKTEEEIANDEARLAFLRRDTTGGNDLAALQLEKELNDQREQYTDNLIDQAIQRLQDDNDVAAEQRERQIEIMQAQLDYQSENGEFNAYIRELLTEAMGADGELLTNSDLVELLKTTENWDALSDVAKQVWDEELTGTFKEVAAWMIEEQNKAQGTYFTAVTAAFNNLSETYNKALIGSYSQGSSYGGSSSSSGSSSGSKGSKGGKGDDKPVTTKVDLSPKSNTTVLPSTGYKAIDTTVKNVVNLSGGVSLPGIFNNAAANKAVEDAIKKKGGITVKKKASRANGGTVNETGWGLLHGTINEPEYVLNARQTEAFLKLADVLPAAMQGNSAISNTFGNSTVNIAVNVDKIDSDYSVDRMVSRIKDQLFSDASYRNVNTLSFIR